MDNGQYEISRSRGGGSGGGRSGRSGDGRRSRGRGGGRRDSSRSRGRSQSRGSDGSEGGSSSDSGGDPVKDAYELLRSTLQSLRAQGRDPVRDSDVKRKMLERDRSFDETELGFGKFSLFLAQAEDDGVITVDRNENGNLQVALDDALSGGDDDEAADEGRDDGTRPDRGDEGREYSARDAQRRGGRPATPTTREEDVRERAMAASGDDTAASTAEADKSRGQEGAEDEEGPTVIEVEPPKRSFFGLRLGPRKGSTRRRSADEVTLLEGQTVTPPGSDDSDDEDSASPSDEPAGDRGVTRTSQALAQGQAPAQDDRAVGSFADRGASDGGNEGQTAASGSVPLEDLALPSDEGAIVRYLTHRYKGVGEKTAEALVARFGSDVFRTLHEDADAIADVVPANRAEKVLEAWRADYERRVRSRR